MMKNQLSINDIKGMFVLSLIYFALDMYVWFPNSGKMY